MKFNTWTVEQLIEYLHLSKQGMDPNCVIRCYGEIHVYNGERKDGQPDLTIDEIIDEMGVENDAI